MLQQTTVAAVAPYYDAFLTRWPNVESLAEAPVEEVMRQWAGLGYYSRARNLHACARKVAAEHGGRFPDTEDALRGLPGIGPYTAAAITAIGFGRRAVVVDGNVERVVSRLYAIEKPLPAAKALIKEKAADLTPFERPGDYAQAMMDLGATICTPRKPACALCPLSTGCAARAAGTPELYPRKAARSERPLRRGAAFFVRRQDGMVLLRTRPPHGLLGGMTEFPGTEWITRTAEGSPREPVSTDAEARSDVVSWARLEHFPANRTPVRVAKMRQNKDLELLSDSNGSESALVPLPAPSRKLDAAITHVFTHFRLELEIYVAEAPRGSAPATGCRWVHESELDREALPSVMRKVLKAVRETG